MHGTINIKYFHHIQYVHNAYIPVLQIVNTFGQEVLLSFIQSRLPIVKAQKEYDNFRSQSKLFQ